MRKNTLITTSTQASYKATVSVFISLILAVVLMAVAIIPKVTPLPFEASARITATTSHEELKVLYTLYFEALKDESLTDNKELVEYLNKRLVKEQIYSRIVPIYTMEFNTIAHYILIVFVDDTVLAVDPEWQIVCDARYYYDVTRGYR